MHEPAFLRLVALVAFVGTYLGLGLGRVPGLRVDRTGIAIIGAAVMVVGGVIRWDQAVAAVDAHTLVLLFGMMVVTAYLRLSGFFALVTAWMVHRATTPAWLPGRPRRHIRGALRALRERRGLSRPRPARPRPDAAARPATRAYLIALATASNVGSVATLTGNPQNMLIGSFSGLSYRSFLVRQAPVAILGLACVFAAVWLAYRRQLPRVLRAAPHRERIPVHYPLMIKTTAAIAAMLVAFLAGAPIALVAIAGAAYLLLTRRVNPAKVYREIDWEVLVLFIGMFVLIGGAEAAGIAQKLLAAAQAVNVQNTAIFTVVTAVLSNVVSNVPAVLLLKPIIASLPDPARAWLLLAMASTLAGNVTIVGSVANLIVVEAARKQGIRIGFLESSAWGCRSRSSPCCSAG